ncbi:hypothetical protein ZHAS_00010040 [Anopheles sinensis]|uniref:Uncharacterized protein n=1 Tax=Anopheles sinensis TaxID=74873 RepID=A0A084VWK3_ANOSI|nr:hypothetical protein ZHAS_00010040 [Anopheles sinensis]
MLVVLLLVSLLSPVLSSDVVENSTSTSGATDEGRFLVRGKPILVYPPTAPTRHQLISGVGVPVVGLPHSVVMGWVLKAQYYLPSLPKDYEPVNVENWNDSRRALPDRFRRGTVERYEVDNVSIRVEPLPVEEESKNAQESYLEEDDDDEDDLEDNLQSLKNMWLKSNVEQNETENHKESTKSGVPPPSGASSSEGYSAANSRWNVYKSIELLSNGYGFGGHVCVLRSICEAAEAQFTHTGGVFAELLHIVFSPSTTNEPVSEHRDNEYYRAEQLGRNGAPCADIFRECSTSLLDMFSGVHDLYSASTVVSDFIPWLIVPETAPTRHQLISGIGIPVGTPESITSGWVMKAQYFLPTKVDDLKPELYWTDEEDEQILGQPADDGVLWPAPKEIDPAQLDGYSAKESRWTLYRALEKLSENYGLPGRPCVLRSVCEAAEAQFTHTGGIFAELLHIAFTPSSTTEPLSEHRDNEYFRAEQLGRTGAPCERIFPECAHSLLDIFTGVHDPNTNEMRLLHDEVKAFLMRK